MQRNMKMKGPTHSRRTGGRNQVDGRKSLAIRNEKERNTSQCSTPMKTE
jgi:hypothetical protein